MKKLNFIKNLTKKQLVILIVAVIVAIALIGCGVWAFFALQKKETKTQQPTTTVKAEKPKAPEKFYSALSGVEVASAADVNKPVIGSIIENSPNARPQSGLFDAEVVFEAIAEGGVTRFLALYQQNQPALIGPVRSLRGYYIDWAGGFQASIAHVGGSGDALARIRDGQHRDMDQFFNAGSFWRARDRYAPHNVYTNFENLSSLNNSKGWSSSNFEGFKFKNDKKSSTPNATQISITMSGPLYDSTFSYNADCNCYLRNQAGAPHLDREKGQISPKNVVALRMNINSRDGYYSDYVTIGSGTAVVFRDGVAEEITWEKSSENSPLTLKDSAGKIVQLNRGQTWLVAVPTSGGAINYQ